MDTRTLSVALVAWSLAVLATACENPTPQAPSVTTPVLPAVTALTITGLASSLAVGQSVQLTASVTLADGTKKLVADATWASSDTKVASVSTAGLLTVTGAGEADVSATFQSVRGVVRVAVSPPLSPSVTYDIAGIVRESAPTESNAVAGATVGIHFAGCPTCPHDNQTTTTDDAGRFVLGGIEQAGFALIVSKPGYETTVYNIAQLPRDQHPSIGVVPEFKIVQHVWEGPRLCHAGQPTPGQPSENFNFHFSVHHDGPLTFQVCHAGFFQGRVLLWQGTQFLREGVCNAVPPTFPPVQGGFQYRLGLGGEACLGSSFRVVFSHPN